MSTVTDVPPVRADDAASQRLRARFTAVRLSFTWLGVRKALSAEQTARAADVFDAAGQYLSAGKKLLDTKHPAFRAVTAVRGRIVSAWKAASLPYPEPGLRLIRQDDVQPFCVRMTTLKAELADAVAALDEEYGALQQAARQRLGTLYNPADYPATLSGLFGVVWDFPSVEPPDYLRQLSPRLYQQEQAKVAARFQEAVALAESAFLEEFGRLISHLCERLAGSDDGQPRVFRDSAVSNLAEFFERFRHLNVQSNSELDELVSRAQQAVRGIQPQSLRNNQSLRQQVASQLAGVQSVLDGLMIDRPRRNLLRPIRTSENRP